MRFIEPFAVFAQSHASSLYFDFATTLTVAALLSMIVGNFSAIWQNNVKRMLAYSSIGHTGFALMAVVAYSNHLYSSLSANAVVFYLSVYAIMNMAAFMLVDSIEEQTGQTNIRKYKGLGKMLKWEFVCFVVILIALTGLPPHCRFYSEAISFFCSVSALFGNRFRLDIGLNYNRCAYYRCFALLLFKNPIIRLSAKS